MKRARSLDQPARLSSRLFGGGSRLIACPVCGKQTHFLLAAAHVESHFNEDAEPAGTPQEVPSNAAAPAAAAAEPAGAGRAADSSVLDEDETSALSGDASALENRANQGEAEELPTSQCGLCCEPFDEARLRYLFWPCQHARQCGACALKVWTQPKARRRCPWCSARLETRPRAYKPFF